MEKIKKYKIALQYLCLIKTERTTTLKLRPKCARVRENAFSPGLRCNNNRLLAQVKDRYISIDATRRGCKRIVS